MKDVTVDSEKSLICPCNSAQTEVKLKGRLEISSQEKYFLL